MCVYYGISIVSGLWYRGGQMTIDSERNQSGLLSRTLASMFPESRPSELSVSAALVVSRLPIALSISSGDVAVDVVFLLGGVFDSEGCEFVAVMVLDASALLTIEAVVTLGRSHDTGRRHSQWISKEAFTGRLFRPFATVPYCGVGRINMNRSTARGHLMRTARTMREKQTGQQLPGRS